MIYIIQFIIGSFLGSFAYCFAYDWVHQQISLSRRSSCDHCSIPLGLIDLMPVVSQLLSFFKCRYCKQPTSSFYIIVEIASGFLMIWSYFIFLDYSIYFTLSFTLISLLIIFCDIHAMIIPDLLQFALFILILYFSYMNQFDLLNQLLLAFTTFVSLLFFNFLRPGSIGGADIKTITILSLSISIELFPLFLFVTSGSALLFIFVRYFFTHKITSPLPFLPFILLGFYYTLSI